MIEIIKCSPRGYLIGVKDDHSQQRLALSDADYQELKDLILKDRLQRPKEGITKKPEEKREFPSLWIKENVKRQTSYETSEMPNPTYYEQSIMSYLDHLHKD